MGLLISGYSRNNVSELAGALAETPEINSGTCLYMIGANYESEGRTFESFRARQFSQ